MSNDSNQWDYTWTLLSCCMPWLFVQLNNNFVVGKGIFLQSEDFHAVARILESVTDVSQAQLLPQ